MGSKFLISFIFFQNLLSPDLDIFINQPRNIFGSAEVAAQAGSTFEIEHHVVMAPGIRKEMNAMIEEGNAITRGEA